MNVKPPSRGYVRLSELFSIGTNDATTDGRSALLHSLNQETPREKVNQTQHLSLMEELAAILILMCFPGCIIWCPILLIFLAYISFQSGYASVILYICVVVLLVRYPHSKSNFLLRHSFLRLLFKYCSLDYAWDAPLTAGKSYMFICPPHGVLPVANLLMLLAFRGIWDIDFYGLTANAALTLPIMRQIMIWIGCKSASRETAKQLLDSGHSIGISPGGVAEIFYVNNPNEVIFIKERTGFVKLAILTGTPLVPCYCFGNTGLFSCWYDGNGRMRRLSRRLGFGIVLVWGRFGLPLLRRQPLLSVTGKPIEVPRVENPSAALIEEYLSKFIDGLQELFDHYKVVYGWEDKKLIIH